MCNNAKWGYSWILAISLWLTTWSIATAEPLMLQPDKDSYVMGPYMKILVDQDSVRTISEIVSAEYDARFVQNDVDYPSFGFNLSNATYWVKMEVVNPFFSAQHMVLEFMMAHFDLVQLYVLSPEGRAVSKTTGQSLPLMSRDINHIDYVFDLMLIPGNHTIYLKLQTTYVMYIPVTLWWYPRFIEEMTMINYLLGIFYGILVLMILYNLAIFFAARDRDYLYYVIFVIASLCFYISYNGLAAQYIWPNFPEWAQVGHTSVVILYGISAAMFIKIFLQTRIHTPRLNQVINGLIGLFGTGVIVILLAPPTIANFYPMLFILPLVWTLMITAWVCLKKGVPGAKYYAFGWAVFLISATLNTFAVLRLLPASPYLIMALPFGTMIEISVFSLALAGKFNTLKYEKYLAQQAVITEQQERELAQQQVIEQQREILRQHRLIHEMDKQGAEDYLQMETLMRFIEKHGPPINRNTVYIEAEPPNCLIYYSNGREVVIQCTLTDIERLYGKRQTDKVQLVRISSKRLVVAHQIHDIEEDHQRKGNRKYWNVVMNMNNRFVPLEISNSDYENRVREYLKLKS